MKLAMIAAMDQNRLIGADNDMPWHLPDDLKHFKQHTLNKPVIMGRKTFESIGSRPLPNRPNLVITRDKSFEAENIQVFHSIDAAIEAVSDQPEVVIMGGGQLYQQCLDRADILYLTLVNATLVGDTHFPDWTVYDWQEVEKAHHPIDERHAYSFDFITLSKNK